MVNKLEVDEGGVPMAFIHPILKMRMKKIIYLLDKANAYSEESAKGINEIGLMNPNFLRGAVRILVTKGIISKTHDEKYYINK